MDRETTVRILSAVDELFDREIAFLRELTAHPSTRGNEQGAQAFMAGELEARGMDVDRWRIDVDDIRGMPGFSPVIGDYEDAQNVVGTLRSATRKGRSLILNGHIDVVSPEPLADWDYDPWGAEIVDGRMYGRGALDMKSGVAMNIFLPRLLRDLGMRLKGDLIIQSVIEEECTGNGALAASLRYKADAALITEPVQFIAAHVGVMWFKVHVAGRSAHAAVAPTGVNAIAKMVPIIQALQELDRKMNESSHPAYAHIDHPINLNIGVIQGGDWPSTVPGECELHCRLSFFPGQTVEEIRAQVEAAINAAADGDEWLREHRPVISYYGFQSGGSTVSPDAPPVMMLGGWHKRTTGQEMEMRSQTGTNDMRYFNFQGIPCGCYGALGQGAHAANEWLDLASLNQTMKTLAAFVVDWCGLEE